jgi:aminoglycoside phosphotransferase (APT) family kinase protein
VGDSTTKVGLTWPELQRVVAACFPDDRVDSCEAVTSGFFNMTYRLAFARRGEAYLRVAPPDGVPVMRYEHSALRAEIVALDLVRARTTVPVPEVLVADTSREIVGRDFIVLSAVSGDSLDEVRGQLDERQGRAIDESLDGTHRELHGIRGAGFGPVDRPAPATPWSAVFAARVEDVLADARDIGHGLPVDAAEVQRIVSDNASVLDVVTDPVFVHWDLWDGNLFVDPARSRISGVIDFEWSCWADPLMDFAFRSVAPASRGPYLRSLVADSTAALRCALYDLYFLLVCEVEASYRGRGEPEDWVRHELDTVITRIRRNA